MRYPIGLQSFDHLREKGYVYVDKTAMVYSLAQEVLSLCYSDGQQLFGAERQH